MRAVKAVLADPRRYRAAYDRPGLLDGWTWEAQAEVLEGVYSRLLPNRGRATIPTPPETMDGSPPGVTQPAAGVTARVVLQRTDALM